MGEEGEMGEGEGDSFPVCIILYDTTPTTHILPHSKSDLTYLLPHSFMTTFL